MDDDDDDDDDEESESESEDDEGEDTKFPKSKLIKGSFAKTLHKWTGEKKRWKLIFRASRDGYTSSAFHSKCDNQGPTVSIIKSNMGNIFGGYNKAAWLNNNQYSNSGENFLFSYKNQEKGLKKPFQMKCHSTTYGAYNGSSYLMTFGGGHDFYIVNNCNTTNSNSNLGHSFTPPTGYTYNQQNAKDLLAGSQSFTVVEIEVYKQ